MNQRTFESLPLAVLPAWSHDDSGAPKARDRTLERPALRNVRPLGFGEHQRAPAGSMLAVSSSSPRLERTVDVVLRPAPGCPAKQVSNMGAMRKRGSGTVYRRGQIWWIQYFVRGLIVPESSHSTEKADAGNLL